MSRAASRLRRWSADRQAHLIRQVRGQVDSFEVAVAVAGLLSHADTGRVLAILEGSQTNAVLGTRLVSQLLASVHAQLGLAVVTHLPEDRLRAALETTAGARTAIGVALTRNPVGSTPAAVLPGRRLLARFETELAAPRTAGVTASTPSREARMVTILTPPSVRHARAAAAAAGRPPPAFIPARYYEDLLRALHTTVQDAWRWAEPMNRRRTLDTRPSGHVEGIATEARARVRALFGNYGAAAPAMTFSAGTLEDRGTIAGNPYDMARWFVNEGSADSPAIARVKQAHHSFEDATASQAIEVRVISHYSGRSPPTAANEQTAVSGLGVATTERTRRLGIIDRMWPGVQTRGTVSVAAREGATRRETRGIYWGLLKTMIHEYLHSCENATYRTWYSRLRDSHHQTTYQEGFTDLFTLKTWRSIYPNEIASNRRFRMRIQGPTDGDLDMRAVGGAPDHYAEMEEARLIEREIGEANMKAAYFRGNTSVLGGARLPR
jgi:hypothetical protein